MVDRRRSRTYSFFCDGQIAPITIGDFETGGDACDVEIVDYHSGELNMVKNGLPAIHPGPGGRSLIVEERHEVENSIVD